jgi:branched-chain amino acid transport system substrate-binding protein
MKHEMISYGARGPEADARKALGSGVDYIFAGIWWSDELPYPQVKKFVADYQAFTGHKVDSWYAAIAYESVRALAAAIQAAGKLDKTAIRDNLRKLQMNGSLVPGQVLKFGSNGQVNYPFIIVQNKPEGKVDIVYPKDSATGQAIAPIPGSQQ